MSRNPMASSSCTTRFSSTSPLRRWWCVAIVIPSRRPALLDRRAQRRAGPCSPRGCAARAAACPVHVGHPRQRVPVRVVALAVPGVRDLAPEAIPGHGSPRRTARSRSGRRRTAVLRIARAARLTTGASTILPRREMTPVPISRARLIASMTSRASSISSCLGRKTSCTTSIWRGLTSDLPVKPRRLISSVSARSPSMSFTSEKIEVDRLHARGLGGPHDPRAGVEQLLARLGAVDLHARRCSPRRRTPARRSAATPGRSSTQLRMPIALSIEGMIVKWPISQVRASPRTRSAGCRAARPPPGCRPWAGGCRRASPGSTSRRSSRAYFGVEPVDPDEDLLAAGPVNVRRKLRARMPGRVLLGSAARRPRGRSSRRRRRRRGCSAASRACCPGT